MKTSNKILWFAFGSLFAVMLIVILLIRVGISHNLDYSCCHSVRWLLGDSKIAGDGKIISHAVPLLAPDDNFHGMDFRMSSDVKVALSQQKAPSTQATKKSTQQQSMPEQKQMHAAAMAIITCDSNLLPYIDVYVNNDVLYFTTKRNVDLLPSRDIKITVNAQDLKSVIVHSSGDFHINNVNSDDFNLEVRGSGRFTLQGTAKNFVVAVSGSGEVNAKNLVADNVKVAVSGSGDALVCAQQSINIDVSGSGSVKYYGSPQKITQNLRGSGDVIKM